MVIEYVAIGITAMRVVVAGKAPLPDANATSIQLAKRKSKEWLKVCRCVVAQLLPGRCQVEGCKLHVCDFWLCVETGER